MSISTAHAVKTALVARLVADGAIGGADVQVTNGAPWPVRPRGDLVVIGAASAGEPIGSRGAGQTPAAVGTRQREERYTIQVTVSIERNPRDPYADLEARAYAIGDAIDTSVRAWADTSPAAYDGVARWVIVAGDVSDQHLVGEDTRECRLFFQLAVAARI